MQKYIGQLIEDIRRATHNIRPPHNLWDHVDVNSDLELEDMAFVEKYYTGDEDSISEITGIFAGLLPLPEDLNEEEKALLSTELERLLQHHNIYLDFPNQLPAHLKYPVIFEFWKEEHVAVSFGKNQIELCDMEKENCPFPGHCKTCDEVEAQMKYDEETSPKVTDEEFNMEKLLPPPWEVEEWFNQQKGSDPEMEFPSGEINGFYNDNGTKINPESVPVPSLCIICKKHLADDWEENLLCLMNRFDQRNDEDFQCGAYEKI